MGKPLGMRSTNSIHDLNDNIEHQLSVFTRHMVCQIQILPLDVGVECSTIVSLSHRILLIFVVELLITSCNI